MRMGPLLIVVTFIVGVAATASANCYVIQNANDTSIKLIFQYNGTIGNGFPLDATVLAHQQFPLDGKQWCWNSTGRLGATIIFTGPGHLRGPDGRVWQGVPIFGDGPSFAPSGIYKIGPP